MPSGFRPLLAAAWVCLAGCLEARSPAEVHLDVGRRKLTRDEKVQCESEITALRDLQVRYAVTRTVHGFTLAVHRSTETVTDFVSEELLRIGSWEGATASRTIEFAASEMGRAPPAWRECTDDPCYDNVMVDVGAHVGWWSFLAASKGWKVLAVEAAPPNVALLELSRCLNPKLSKLVTVKSGIVRGSKEDCVIAMPSINLAAGNTRCQFKGKDVEWTEEQIADLKDDKDGPKLDRVYRVPVVRIEDVLDDAWEQDGRLPHRIALMKLDIEGSEYAALNGTLTWLKKGRVRVVHSEMWADIDGGVEGYVSLFHRFGYSVRPQSCLNPAEIKGVKGSRYFRRTMEPIVDICARLPLPDD